MNKHTIARFTAFVCALLSTGSAWCADNSTVLNFANHSQLVFSDPVTPELAKLFGPGWTHLTFISAAGTRSRIVPDEALTTDGGVIFSLPIKHAISADGRYIALNLTRNGVLDADESGKSTTTSRQSCPILDTATGCVVRDDSGDICGGEWDPTGNGWHDVLGSGKSKLVSDISKPTAKDVWTRFSGSQNHDIKSFIDVALGLDNLKACDPPSATNQRYYSQIEAALSRTDNPTPSDKTTQQQPPVDGSQPATVKSERAQLFAQPSVGSVHHGYLIRGDHVTIIGTGNGGWLHIRYERAGKPPIEAWLQSADVTH
ncbi:hypothetical protein [Burkholderia plantarii]|uniref:hypothetical protein n=1 Tax=Burkholderia plantarii TaxID=41899 RepID=UPI0018DBA9D7|nr:hypothetical protein [Burkholderia plantarii]MBI0330803.1 hypothetical protein [Burkholderia plantarii]